MDTRTSILNHAERAARQKGHKGFSFDKIARNVGIRKASMYHHFSTKSALVLAMFRRYAGNIYAALEDIDGTEQCAGNRLLIYLSQSRLSLDDGNSICLSIALCTDHESLGEEVVEELELFQKANLAWLTKTFELGQRDGSIPGIGDPQTEAIACLALVDGAQIMARSRRDVVIFDKAMMQIRERLSSSDLKSTKK